MLARRAAAEARDGVRDDRLRAAPRRPARDPGPRSRSPASRSRSARQLTVGGRGAGRRRGSPAGHAALGAGGPGPVRAVRDRGLGGDPQRPAVRPRRGPEPAPPGARRGQGRLPARRLAQPPDAAGQHSRLRTAAGRRGPGPAAGHHHRAGRPAVPHGPPAAHGEPDRVRCPAPAARGVRARPRACGGRGRPWAQPTSRSRSRTGPRDGWRWPTRDQLDQVLWALLDNAVGYGGRTPISVAIRVDPATPRRRDHHHGPRPRRREADRERLFGRFERGAERPPARARAWACTCRGSCAGRWAATSCWSRRPMGAAQRSPSGCPARRPRRPSPGDGRVAGAAQVAADQRIPVSYWTGKVASLPATTVNGVGGRDPIRPRTACGSSV